MRRHYLDAEEIGALLDTSGRRGNAEVMLVPRAGRNTYQKDGINLKMWRFSAEVWPLSTVLPAGLSSTPSTQWCHAFTCSFFQITAETKGGMLFFTLEGAIAILSFLTLKIWTEQIHHSFHFSTGHCQRECHNPLDPASTARAFMMSQGPVMFLLLDVTETCWKCIEQQQFPLSSNVYQLDRLITYISPTTKASFILANMHVLDDR